VIPVEIWGARRWHKLWVYVDSGASLSILHTFEARRLGVNLSKCKKFYIVAAGDHKIPVYTKKMKFKIGKTAFNAEVGFCRALGGTFNLLGRKDVFERFEVVFSDKKERIIFRKT
jgi:hypothetical protein